MSSAARPLAVTPPVPDTVPDPHPAFGMTDVGLLFMALIWAVNFSVVKYGLNTLAPLTFSAMRMTIAAVVLTTVAVALKSARMPSQHDMVRLFGLGLLGNGLYQVMFMIGMTRTRAGIAALVVAAGPAWIAIVSRFIGHERVPLRGWTGIALQLIGVTTVVISTKGIDTGTDAMFGTALIVGGSILWAFYAVMLQPYTARVHPMYLAAFTMISGAIMLLALAIPGLLALQWGTLDLPVWGTLAYSSIGALVIGYLLFYRGVRVLGPTRTSMYGNLQPIIALTVAWMFLAERPTMWQWIGTALIMGGLLVSRTARVLPSPARVTLAPLASEARPV